MAVILANTTFLIARKTHAYARDEQGAPVAAPTNLPPTGPFPGAFVTPAAGEHDPNAVWNLRADTRHGAVTPDDRITSTVDGRVFIVATARTIQVPGIDLLDHIQITATLEPTYVP